MDDMWKWVANNVPWKEITIAVLTGALGFMGVMWSGWDKKRLAREERAASEDAAREKTRNALEISQGQDLTARFKALMDGYESRILDLTRELATSRAEVSALRAEIDGVRNLLTAQQDRCRMCPYLVGLEGSNAG